MYTDEQGEQAFKWTELERVLYIDDSMQFWGDQSTFCVGKNLVLQQTNKH